MKHSDRWNPLAENENINDVQTSANVIISNTQKKSGKDEFWPRAEENLLKAFLFYFLQILVDQNNLTNIYKKVASGDLQKLTSASDIDLTLPGKMPCIYYIVTDDMNGAYDFLSSLFYTFLFIKLVRYADSQPNGKCDVDVFCFLDEFANIGQIPDFNKKISTVRSRGIALIPITQNKGQLDNRYPNKVSDEIIGNCDTTLGLGTTDILTAQFFCDLIGVSTAETVSIRKENSLEGEIEEYGQKNISTLQRNLLNKDEILRLPSSKLLAILRGNKPLLLDKMRYTEHSLAKKLSDSSIYDFKPNWTKNTNLEDRPKKTPKKNIKKRKRSFENF